MIKWKISFYAYKLELSSEMKVHSTFHVSLLWFLKNNLIDRQMLSLQFMIVENKENLYFIDSIDDMKWNTKFTWFELLIKWEEYEWRTWELYTTIKKNTSALIKEFHQDHSSWSVSTEWIKEENWWLLSNTWIMKTWIMKTKKNMKLTEIMTSILIEMKTWNSTWNTILITHT